MKVLYLSNIPSPYRVDYFNELGKFCDLTVLFEVQTSTERDEEWKKFCFENFRGIFLKGRRINADTAFCPGIGSYLKRGEYDFVIVTVLASPTALLAVNVLRRRKIPYYYEGDGGFAGKTTGFKAMLKHYIISGARKCFSTSAEFDRYCTAYGAKQENILRYPFTSVKRKEILAAPLTREEKQERKREFGVAEGCAIVSVGQFIHRKGFDLLLECCEGLSKDVSVYVVGGKPTKEYLALWEKYGLSQVHFMEFMPREQLMRFFRAMDFFVLFTREDIWGLVINEALANGLPVVSTDRCIAALELIAQGENGFIVQTENKPQMKEAMRSLAESEELREKMSREAIRRMENYTIENMAAAHMKVFAGEGNFE